MQYPHYHIWESLNTLDMLIEDYVAEDKIRSEMHALVEKASNDLEQLQQTIAQEAIEQLVGALHKDLP
jgi:hypothetical protein